MSDLRKAAERIVEAAEKIDGSNELDNALEALFQALAQPEQEPVVPPDVSNIVLAAVLTERERCAKIALSGTGEPVQVATLEILRKERERIATNIMEIEK